MDGNFRKVGTGLFRQTTKVLFMLLMCAGISGCSIGYYTNAGYQQFRILLSRKSIEKSLNDPETPQELKHKLKLTKEARTFAKELGLNPKKTFTTYATRKNIPTIWVLTAAEKFKLEPYLWNFPVVGALPYKGFFSKKDAEKEQEKLLGQGLDVSLRTTAAYSTLGWFNDPLMPSTLLLDDLQLFNTVVHEITHTTLWIPGSTSFNETFAHTVGLLGTLQYFTHHTSDPEKKKDSQTLFLRECTHAHALSKAYKSLNEIFDKKKNKGNSEGEIEKEKLEIYSKLGMEANNALFLAYYTYFDRFHLFLESFKINKNIKEYILAIQTINNNLSREKDDPYKALKSYILSNTDKESPESENDLCKEIIALMDSKI